MSPRINGVTHAVLIEKAWQASGAAYSPYSGFCVGAALLCQDGTVYTGCNVENISYGPSICAERTALVKAVSEGHQDFAAIAVVGNFRDKAQRQPELFSPPCGICRQVLSEFCDADTFKVILANERGDEKTYLLKELLPEPFAPYR